MRSGMCVAPRQLTRLHVAEQVVQHVAPVAEHVDDDPAVVFLAVVPGRALGGDGVALEHPVAELAAHREDLAEEVLLLQAAQLQQAGQPQLVLHHAVLHAGLGGHLVQLERGLGVHRRRLLAVDVLAGGDRLAHALGPAAGGLGVEVDLVLRIAQHGVEVGGDLLHARLLAQLAQLVRVAADQDRVGHDGLARPSITPPCLMMATIERMRCWLVPMRPVTPFMMMPTLCVFMDL